MPKENIWLIEGIHDLLVPKEDVEDLFQAWGKPDIWRVSPGASAFVVGGAPRLTGRILRWLLQAHRMN